jgi:hypothetical protein
MFIRFTNISMFQTELRWDMNILCSLLTVLDSNLIMMLKEYKRLDASTGSVCLLIEWWIANVDATLITVR